MSVTNKAPATVLIKKIKENVLLEGVTVKSDIYTKRKIKPLEWAIIAPMIKLTPKPTLEEIAKEFGLERIEFLTHLADQMEVDGILNQREDGSVEVTTRGEQLFGEGMMICYPHKTSCELFYEPSTKEWLTLFKNKKNDENSDDTVNSESMPISDETRVPSTILEKYLRHYQLIKKEENIVDYKVQSINKYHEEVEAGVFLRPDTVDIIVSGDTFSEYNKIISAALKRYLMEGDRLKEHLSDIFEFESWYGKGDKVQTMDLGDCKVFSPIFIEKMYQELLSDNPKWVITRLHRSIHHFIDNQTKPRVIICYGNNEMDDTNAIFPPVVLLRLITPPKNFLIATDKYVVTLKTVVNNAIEVPMLIVEPNDRAIEIDEFLEHDTSIMNKEKALLAKTYLNPDIYNWEKLCKHILHYYGKGLTTHYKVNDFIELKSSLGIAEISPSEGEIYELLIQPSGYKELVAVNDKIIEKIKEPYLKRLETVLRDDLGNITIKDAVERHAKINGKFKDSKVSGLYERVKPILNNYIILIADQINRFKASKVDDDIESAISLLEVPAIRDRRDSLLLFVSEKIRGGDLSADKALPIYQKMARYGFKIDENEINRIGKQMLKGFQFSWTSEETHKKITMVDSRCKQLYTGFNIRKILAIPVYEGNYINKKELNALIDNIFTAHLFYPEIDHKFVTENINKIEANLRQGITKEFFERWLLLIEKTRTAEKKNNQKYLKLTDEDIVKKISGMDKELIDSNKNTLKSMGLWDRKNSDIKAMAKRDKPPLEKIVVDGSNVARQGLKDKRASSHQLINTYKKLTESGFSTIRVFISASLKYSMQKEEYVAMIKFFERESKKQGHDILLEAPAATDDDYHIIHYAIDENTLILTNDTYKNHQETHPELKDEIKKRRVTYMIISGKVQIGEYPDK